MFQFLKPAVAKPNNGSTDAELLLNELLLNLSIFGFSRLSASDQREETEDICNKVVESVTVEQLSDESVEDFQLRKFAELFKKLPLPEQNFCLSRVIKKLIHERQSGELICWFQQLDANLQQRMIREITGHVPADSNLQIPGETEEDFRLRRFTRLSRDYTDYVYKHLAMAWDNMKTREDHNEVIHEIKEKGDHDDGNWDWQSRFAEFFLGFSIIWFKGQRAEGQKLLIQQLRGGLGCERYFEKLPDESEEDLRLRIFTELCEQVHVFDTQLRFLGSAEKRLKHQQKYLPHGRVVQPQGSAGAAELLSRLSALGFSLLSAADQQETIKKLYNQVEGDVIGGLAGEISDEQFRKETFTELFNKVPVTTRIRLFREVKEKFFREREFCESIILFRQLGSNDQQYMLEKMLDKSYGKNAITEKLIEESEEDFRLRRFIKLYKSSPYNCFYSFSQEAHKLDQKGRLPTSADEEEIKEIKQARYAEFFFGLSIIWFKARCANDPRNLIQILFRQVNVEVEVDHIIEKLPDETKEDFRLRRFKELFKKLPVNSQVRIVDYIQKTICHDLGHPYFSEETKKEKKGDADERPRFVPEFIKIKAIKGGATTRGGGGATTQGGQGKSQQ